MLAELKRRRVLPLLGVYLGAAWVGVEFSNFMVERYHLSQGWIDALIAMIALMLPAVMVFAYNHGAPGPDRWTRMERFLLPINLLIAVSVAVLVFGDRPMGAMADTLERVDEEGQKISRTVAREGYQQRLLLFGLRAADEAPELKPLALALPKMIETSLGSDPFIEPESVSGNARFLARLRRSAGGDGSDVPAALRRRMAQEARYSWILSGEMRRTAAGWTATLQLAGAAAGGQEVQLEVAGKRLTDLADAASTELRSIMARQIGSPDLATGATLDEQFSSNDEAVAAYLRAEYLRDIQNDQVGARAELDRALELDASFARAYLLRARVALDEGRQAEAQADLVKVLAHDYRLNDPGLFKARAMNYGINGQSDKRVAVSRLWTELHPASAEAQIHLAMTLNWFGNEPSATIAAFERVLELSPNSTWVYLGLAELHLAQGQIDQASAAAEKFGEAEPKSARGPRWEARMALNQGEFMAAAAHAERAALLRPELVGPLLDLAEIDALQGNWQGMERHLDGATGVAAEPRQQITVLCVRAQLYVLAGWLQRALQHADECAEVAKTVATPLVQAMDIKLPFSGLRTQMLGLEKTLAEIEVTLAGFDGEMRRIGSFARMFAYLHADRADEAEHELNELVDVLANWNRQDLDYMVALARGRIAQMRGDYAQAATELAEGIELYDSSGHRNMGAAGFLSLHLSLIEHELRALVALGESAQALERGERAIVLFPGVAAIQLAYAEAAFIAGKVELASQSLQRVEALWAEADEVGLPTQRISALRDKLPVNAAGPAL